MGENAGMLSELHIIWNPIAGNGAAVKVFALVSAALDERGIPFTSAKSAYPGNSTELARIAVADGAKKIVALGGDGTVREVASALCGTDIEMGIIPCGTGNDMVRPLGVSKDPMTALETVLHGSARRMDACMANDEFFFNVAGFGFDVDVLDYTEIYKKRFRNGSMAYLCGLLRAVAGLSMRKTVITWPEGRMEKDVLLLAAGNGTHFGGGMPVAPMADPFDGLLDICVMHDVTRFTALRLLLKFLKGRHLAETKYFTFFRTTELTAACEPFSRLDIDGEVVPGTPVTFKILPKSLLVLLPDGAMAAE